MIRSIPVIFAERAVKHLIRRFFGQYLEFAHQELTWSLKKGKGILEDVSLKVEALNELSEDYNLPIEFLRGSIDNVSVEIPWTKPFTENSIIEFKGMNLVVQPKRCADDVSMFGSMWESMTTSLQLAEECLQEKLENEPEFVSTEPIDAVNLMVSAINLVVAKMKFKLVDTVIRIENVLESGDIGVALEIRIKSAECFDEIGVETSSGSDENLSAFEPSGNQTSAYSVKKCMLEGISLYTALFSTSSCASETVSSPTCTEAYLSPGSPEMPPPHTSLLTDKKEDEGILPTEPILISRINGQQQLRLKLKQNEGIVGPKVDIEANLGLVNFFLTPFQVHMLIELANGLTRPSSSQKNNSPKCPPTANNRPMRPEDFALIEQELQRQHNKLSGHSRSLQNHCGWSSQSLDDSGEEFHLMTMENKITMEVPTVNEDLESSCSSSMTSENMQFATRSAGTPDGCNIRRKSKGSNLQTLLSDPLAESTQLRASCSSLCVVILHEDAIMDTTNKDSVLLNYKSPENIAFLRSRAERYFDELAALSMEGLDFKDFGSVKDKLSRLCQTNQIRILASSVTFEGNEKTSQSQRLFSTSLTMLDLEILECVFNIAANGSLPAKISYTELMSFNKNNLKTNFGNFKEPCVRIKYDRIDYGSQQLRLIKLPANKITFQFAPVSFEVDISLTDRIRAFLNPDPIFSKKDRKYEASYFSWRDEENNSRQMPQRTEVQVFSPFVVVNLRFPIPDFRPLHDMERTPWWQQNVCKEVLVMEMIDTSLAFTIDSEQTRQKVELQCRDFHGLLRMSENEEPFSFLRVSVDPEAEKAVSDKGFDWPRLVLHIVPEKPNDLLEYELMADKEDLCPMSFTDTLLSNMDKEPSPFCSNAVFYGSKFNVGDNQEPNKNGQEISSEDNELIRPADKEKILNFIEQTTDRTLFYLEFSLPTVNASFPDKQFFELLYNRLCDDLILWENAPINNHDSSTFKVHAPSFDLNPQALKDSNVFRTFYNCVSNNLADSNSESEDDDGIYYSVSEHYMKHKQRLKKIAKNHSYTKISINMNIQKGAVAVCNALLDNAGNVVPGYCSKMQLVVEECKFFLASSYKGDPFQSYLCLLSNKGTLYHKGSTLFPIERQVVQPFSQSYSKGWEPIIYLSEVGIPTNSGIVTGCGGDSLDVLSIAVHTVNDTKQQIKTYKIALGISGTTLRHHMCPASQLWLNQLIDFISVTDYPISGYIPPAVVVELHLHLSNCAIDYRPLYLPLKTVLTFENFSLSTNITASTKTSLLRIISEELCLFISNNMAAKSVDLKKDYVCVLDTGLVDLSVRLTNSDGKSDPKFEMCASNNMIHIRTCADSCQALQQLIVYFASYGDLIGSIPVIAHVVDESNRKPTPNSSPPAGENVHNLMVEAMKDYSSPQHLGNGTRSPDSEFSTDEEFCILEDDPGVGVLPKNREPQIRILTNDPIRVIENHFSIPSGKSDLLKAPKHFPQALLCHTLREMSITWHLYGGNDFNVPKCNEKKHVRISKSDTKDGRVSDNSPSDENQSVKIDAGKSTISFCKVTPLNRDFSAMHYAMESFCFDQGQNSSARSWILKGGEGRNHDVLMELQMHKVRFQHEEYPEDSEYASRDVLLIHDIEIRDRLAASQINKFLYQYSSESMPRQTHANMVVVKAVHVRPDPNNKKIQECSLKVSCKPLRLNIDQDALMFLFEFFKEFFRESPPGTPRREGSVQDLQVHATFSPSPTLASSPETTKNLLFSPVSPPSTNNKDISSLTFFRSFAFSPDVLIRLDYHGKRVIMEQGALQGILMGLGHLNCSEIKLRRLSYRHGFLGVEKLMTYAVNEWLQDIKKNQLPSLLGGIGPMHSFVQMFQGLKDLVWLPVEQYRKDGQIVRGLQRGASSFTTSTAAAFLELTSRLFGAIQEAAEVAYDMVSPGPTIGSSRAQSFGNQTRRTSQPADIREGMTTAYNVVKEGLGDTARTIVQVATVEHEHKGVRGAVGGVLRQIPPATVKPIILGTEATCIMLGGMKHQLVPDAHKEAKDKWRTKN